MGKGIADNVGAHSIIHFPPPPRLPSLLNYTIPTRPNKPSSQCPKINVIIILHFILEKDYTRGRMGEVFDQWR
jgi:hypothetical protein